MTASPSSASSEAAVVARGLEKRFGGVHALRGMDLEVPAGSCFGLIGNNGAGKTTFIKLLLGICHADKGSVRVLDGTPADVHVRRRIGYLPERLSLPAALTPMAFLRSVGRLKGLRGREMDAGVPKVLGFVGLAEEAWRRRMGGFSKGMKQRTGLAAALLGDPALLVLDEPTDGIDPLGRTQIRGVISAAVRRGTTVFLNSHLLTETEKICDHVAVVASGKVIVSGPLSLLKRKDAFRVRFRPDPAVTNKVLELGFVEDQAASALEDDPKSALFRFSGSDAGDLSRALAGALAAGAIVLEVTPELKDLEAILAEAVSERAS